VTRYVLYLNSLASRALSIYAARNKRLADCSGNGANAVFIKLSRARFFFVYTTTRVMSSIRSRPITIKNHRRLRKSITVYRVMSTIVSHVRVIETCWLRNRIVATMTFQDHRVFRSPLETRGTQKFTKSQDVVKPYRIDSIGLNHPGVPTTRSRNRIIVIFRISTFG